MPKGLGIGKEGFFQECHIPDLSPYVDGSRNNPGLAWSKGLQFSSLTTQEVSTTLAGYPHGLLSTPNDWVFASYNISPAKILRWKDVTDLSTYQTLTFASDGIHNECFKIIYIPSKDKIYAVFNTSGRIVVSEIDPYADTLSYVDVINDTNHSMTAWGSITTDNTYLYAVTATSPTKVVKYSLSTWAEVANTTLTDLNTGHAVEWDGAGSLIVTGASSPGWVAKVATSNLAYSSYIFPSGDNTVTDDICVVAGKAYIGIESGTGVFYIFNISDLSFTRYSGGWSGTCYGAFFDGRYVIVTGLSGSDSRLIFVDPLTQEMWVRTMSGLANVNEIIRVGQFYIYTRYASPGYIGRMTLEGGLTKVRWYEENEIVLPTSVGDTRGCRWQTVTVDTNSVGVGAALTLAADGNYDMAQGNSLTTMKRVVIALESGTGSKKVAVRGLIYTSTTLTAGDYIYVSPTSAGNITQIQPSATDHVVTPIGIALTANVWQLYEVEQWAQHQ